MQHVILPPLRALLRVILPLQNLGPFFRSSAPLARIGPAVMIASWAWIGWLALQSYAPFGTGNAVGVAFGAMSILAMAEIFVLAARPRLLEPLFGGLDRMYRLHKWGGIAALLFMFVHNQIEPDFERLAAETPSGSLAGDLGELAFNGFLALILISWFRRLPFTRFEIPYQLWRLSHRAMGVLFALAAYHQFFVDVPASVPPSLANLLALASAIGLAAWAYTEVLAPRLRRRLYHLRSVTRAGDVTTLRLAPNSRAMRWTPGQFAFLRAPEAGLGEPHPFTLANAPDETGEITLAIRGLGDWTRRLGTQLTEGGAVEIEGPYGRFSYQRGGKTQLWLAGGIGITPFLAFAESLSAAQGKAHSAKRIHLIHCVRRANDALGVERLKALAAQNPHFTYALYETGQEGRLTADQLIAKTPFPLRQSDLWFCGPEGLKSTLLHELKEKKQSPKRLRYEHFDFA